MKILLKFLKCGISISTAVCVDELDGDCNTQVEHGRIMFMTARRTTPVQLPFWLGWRRELRLGVEEGVGMECNLRKSMEGLVESDKEFQITFDTDITFMSSDEHSNGESIALLNAYC